MQGAHTLPKLCDLFRKMALRVKVPELCHPAPALLAEDQRS